VADAIFDRLVSGAPQLERKGESMQKLRKPELAKKKDGREQNPLHTTTCRILTRVWIGMHSP